MDYKGQADLMRKDAAEFDGPGYIIGDLRNAAQSITDLLARAEAAEQRCETLEKIVKEYQEELIPGYRDRAEKAEKCIEEIKNSRDHKRPSYVVDQILEEWNGQKEE